MNKLMQLLGAMETVDFMLLLALSLLVLWVVIVSVFLKRSRFEIDRNWVKVHGAGGIVGVVKPTGYVVTDAPKTLEGRVMPTRKLRSYEP